MRICENLAESIHDRLWEPGVRWVNRVDRVGDKHPLMTTSFTSAFLTIEKGKRNVHLEILSLENESEVEEFTRGENMLE